MRNSVTALPLALALAWGLLQGGCRTRWDRPKRSAQPTERAAGAEALEQGWAEPERAAFGQAFGSRWLPIDWFLALEDEAGGPLSSPALAARHGLLWDPGAGLPVGLVVEHDEGHHRDPELGGAWLGLSCAACHTGWWELPTGERVTVEGGPGRIDLTGLMQEVREALAATAADPARFERFRGRLGEQAAPLAAALEREQARQARWWRAVAPAVDGGPGRLDAFNGVFNWLLAEELGVPENHRPVDAPVSIPALWDATVYDHVEWNGASTNAGVGPLARNLVVALGAFSHLEPLDHHHHRGPAHPGYDSSIRTDVLIGIEQAVGALRAPAWPAQLGPLDAALSERGRALYDARCLRCHQRVDQGDPDRGPRSTMVALATVGTDPAMARGFLERTALAGPLQGAHQSVIGGPPIPAETSAFGLVSHLVTGVMLRHPEDIAHEQLLAFGAHRGTLQDEPELSGHPGIDGYRARSLNGIWATAPYLHNGSVPTLADLLRRPEDRPVRFATGDFRFDPERVGLAPADHGFVLDTTIPGNHNGGHLWGTDLSEPDRRALLEYLKGL